MVLPIYRLSVKSVLLDVDDFQNRGYPTLVNVELVLLFKPINFASMS
jgi:hypothetical protein